MCAYRLPGGSYLNYSPLLLSEYRVCRSPLLSAEHNRHSAPGSTRTHLREWTHFPGRVYRGLSIRRPPGLFIHRGCTVGGLSVTRSSDGFQETQEGIGGDPNPCEESGTNRGISLVCQDRALNA